MDVWNGALPGSLSRWAFGVSFACIWVQDGAFEQTGFFLFSFAVLGI